MAHAMRIRTPGAKFATVFVGTVVVLLFGIGLAAVVFGLGYLSATVLTVALVVFTARLFRGTSESPEPREWWRMTAAPASAFIVGALFLLQAVSSAFTLLTSGAPGVVWIGVAVGFIIAAAYIHSAVRLSRQRVRT